MTDIQKYIKSRLNQIHIGATGEPWIESLMNKICEKIQKRQGKKIGSGAVGSVYEYIITQKMVSKRKNTNKNKYVVKIENCDSKNDINKLKSEMVITNKVHRIDLAPRIYGIRKCDKSCLTIMDYIEHPTFYNYMDNIYQRNTESDANKIIKKKIDIFFNDLEKIHNKGLFHGDLHFSNVLFDEKKDKFIFIDFHRRNKKYLPIYDYALLIAFLKFHWNNFNSEIRKYIFQKAMTKLVNFYRDIFGNDVSMENDELMYELFATYDHVRVYKDYDRIIFALGDHMFNILISPEYGYD